MLKDTTIEKDRAHYFHPVVPIRAHEKRGVTVMKSGKGVYLTDADDNELLDGFAGLWCVNAGYGHEVIVEAAAEQMRRLPFGHGFTYAGHPVSATVALEVIKLYEGGLIENSKKVGVYFEKQLAALLDHPVVGDVRSKGLLAAIEIVTDKVTKSKPTKQMNVATRLARAGYKNGIIFRAFADDVIGLAPPICITEAEVDILITRLRDTLDTITDIIDKT